MKVLWITNLILPEANKLSGRSVNPFGGWMDNASGLLAKQPDISLSIASPVSHEDQITVLKGERITYYLFPYPHQHTKKMDRLKRDIISLLEEIQPQIVHIFGTEFSHSCLISQICKELKIKCVVSIQGMVSVAAKHYMAHLPCITQHKYSFRDFIKRDNLLMQQKKYIERGSYEVKTIESADYIIGRTTWDQACCFQINDKCSYFACNETLRSVFYHHQWQPVTCEKYSIFASQASVPLKGAHHLIEAMPIILKQFPEANLYIAGPDITRSATIKEKLKLTAYGQYLKNLIKKHHLGNHIHFIGILSEREMCARYLKAHVFVCPSSIENSPNSLGEAMLLGVRPGHTLASDAADAAARGDRAQAIAIYAQLAREQPSEPAYASAARILMRDEARVRPHSGE